MRKKRFLSFVMALAVLLCMLAGTQPALADVPTPMFDFDSSTGTITGYNGSGGDVAIPETIEGVAVTAIGAGAFESEHNITSITIPASITNIGCHSFDYCTDLMAIYFEGDKPVFDNSSSNFMDVDGNCKVYYKSTSTGFEDKLYGRPTYPLYRSEIASASGGSLFFKSFAGGSIPIIATTSAGAAWIAEDTTVDLEIVPDTGMQLKRGSLKYNNGMDHPVNGTSFAMPAGQVTVSAEFMPVAAKTYAVTVETLTGGSITPNLTDAAPGEIINLVISPSEGKMLKAGTLKYSFDGQAYDISGTSFTMPEGDVSITAEFEAMDYEFDSFTGTITKYTGAGGNVIIPSQINGVTVTAIGDSAFEGCSTLTGVRIPDGVTGIGEYAFFECVNLISATLPDSIKSLGDCIFYQCDLLASVNIPAGITEIPDCAFQECYALKSITIPSNITRIGENAFALCSGLESIIIPASVTSIGDFAFAGPNFGSSRDNISAVIFLGNAPTLGNYVFDYNASDLKIYYSTLATGFTPTKWNNYTTESYDPSATYTVTYNANGGTGDVPADASTYQIGDYAEIAENGGIAKTGYVFGGWNIAASGLGINYEDGDRMLILNESVTLYANWIRMYAINIASVQHGHLSTSIYDEGGKGRGSVKAEASVKGGAPNVTAAKEGEQIRVVVEPDEGWRLKSGSLKYNDGEKDCLIEEGSDGEGEGFEGKEGVPEQIIETGGKGKPSDADGLYVFEMPASDITISAVFESTTPQTPDDGDTSSGGGTTTPPATPPPAPVTTIEIRETPGTGNRATIITGIVNAYAKDDGKGNATVALTEGQVKDALNKALAEAARKGGNTEVRVEIKVTAPTGAKSVETSIPKAAVDAVAGSKAVAMNVSTPLASLSFDGNSLDTISKAAGDLKISIAGVDAAALSNEAKRVIGGRPVINFNVTCGNKTISQFGGNVTVSIPYTPKAGEDTNAIVIYCINSEGKPEAVGNCAYDPATGTVRFKTNHLSTYAVGYNKVDFKDVPANARYAKAAGFVAARGITDGTGNGSFSPEAKLTRGQLLVMLMRAYGIGPDKAPKDNFSDAGNTYYTGYLAAAKRLGISDGIGSNKYAPEKEITRQEMYTLAYNVLKSIGQLPADASGKTLKDFTDADKVANWAKDAMTFMVNNGIVVESGSSLLPDEKANRAYMAQVLYNLLTK